ncbi:hypothetical protein Salat_1525700 [Sesamum alatum]|uniref:Uncharacterized protein n=1 Tax=Sesamum alatum TaxID=300844 RepID=A0AAE1YCE6_9LAMI|nr:hypothetical protein Salat_1525700 [Sesamum alatum]
MEGFAKVLLILTLLLGVLSMDVKGGRALKGDDQQVDQPQTFGSFGGAFPAPFPGLGGSFPGAGLGGSIPGSGLGGSIPGSGLGGSIPGSGLGGSFPGSGLGGSIPGSGLGGSIPGSGLGGSIPNPGLGSGSSSSRFCSFRGVRCAPVQSRNPAGSNGGVSASP